MSHKTAATVEVSLLGHLPVVTCCYRIKALSTACGRRCRLGEVAVHVMVFVPAAFLLYSPRRARAIVRRAAARTLRCTITIPRSFETGSKKGNVMLRSALLAALMSAAIPMMAFAQTAGRSRRTMRRRPGDVLVYGMGYSGNRYSPLTQINKENVSKLVPVWAYSLADLQGGESFPLVKDGVIYVTTHDATAAVDAITGKQIWRVKHEYPPETLRVVCCGIVNRGAAIYDGMIIRALHGQSAHRARRQDRQGDLDGQVAGAGDTCQRLRHDRRAAGRERRRHHRAWPVPNSAIAASSKATMPRPASISGGPTRSRPRASRAPRPGKAIPALTGGGSSWVTGTYDPELDLVYWGIGNPAPWNARARKGDNLFTNSVFAIRPKTGERVWYFQTTPNDPFDYDAVQTPIIATINVGGSPRKVVIQANRSGFLYVLDAKDGKLVAANAFGKVNWASGIDKETGRPIVTDVFTGALEGKNVTVWPSISGVTNWQHLSFSPQTGMLYINTLHVGMTYEAGEPPKLTPGKPSGAPTVKRTVVTDDPNIRGFLKAVDPVDRASRSGRRRTRARTTHRPW